MRKLLENIAATAEIMGREISPSAAMVMAQDLEKYPADVVVQALANLRRDAKARFSTGAIIEQIEKLQPDCRPGADEAWSMIPHDESATVVWTEEMAQAFGIAKPLLAEGDKIGARMAFRDAYNRIVEQSKRNGAPVRWVPSLGHDPAGREAALTEAARLGRLSHAQVAGLLPQRDELGIAAALVGNSPLRLATVDGDPVVDAQTLNDAKVKLAELRAALRGAA